MLQVLYPLREVELAHDGSSIVSNHVAQVRLRLLKEKHQMIQMLKYSIVRPALHGRSSRR